MRMKLRLKTDKKAKALLISALLLIITGSFIGGYFSGLNTAGDINHIVADMLTFSPNATDTRLTQGALLANTVREIDDPALNELYEEIVNDFLFYINENWLEPMREEREEQDG